MTRITSCQACGSQRLTSFYEVPNIPVHSCLMVRTRDEAVAFPKGQLELAFCEACGFIQNVLYDASLQHYSTDYEETQAFSPRFLAFLDEICDDQNRKYQLAGKTALEIGCGKGEFLVTLCERAGCSGIGIDPGYRPERTTSPAADRLQFIQDFYGPAYKHLQADYVCCRHTLEHIGPVGAFVRLVRESIGDRPQVDVFFELPDVERVLEECAFWDIYYEHSSYFTLGSLARLFRASHFEVELLWKAYDGQYLMLEGRPTSAPTVARLPEEDDVARTRAQVQTFRTRILEKHAQLRADVAGWKKAGKKVAIWGSGSKGVSYLTTLGFGDEIDAVVDINPHKWGRFLAGTGHEIVGPDALKTLRPDVVVVMNPIYVAEIGKDLADRGLYPQIVPL
ncbi:MAG: class I SAM-dependent methyltransferase [Geminicoccaceae bacterium]